MSDTIEVAVLERIDVNAFILHVNGREKPLIVDDLEIGNTITITVPETKGVHLANFLSKTAETYHGE
jgi:hypothetical protein